MIRRIFLFRDFNKWRKKKTVSLTDSVLRKAVEEISVGLYEANLGGGVIKKRIAVKGRGKSSSSRTIVAFEGSKHTFYMLGFLKSDMANISKTDVRDFKELAAEFLSLEDSALDILVEQRTLIEIS